MSVCVSVCVWCGSLFINSVEVCTATCRSVEVLQVRSQVAKVSPLSLAVCTCSPNYQTISERQMVTMHLFVLCFCFVFVFVNFF